MDWILTVQADGCRVVVGLPGPAAAGKWLRPSSVVIYGLAIVCYYVQSPCL